MKFLNLNSDLTLIRNKTEKICLTIISILMFIVTMSLANSYVTNLLLKNDPTAMSGKITIEFAPTSNSVDGILTDKEKKSILTLLSKMNGIKDVKIIPISEMKTMFTKFIPGIELPKNMPFPTIFEVNTQANVNINIQKLSQNLSAINPSVRIYNHEELSNSANKLTVMFKFVSICLSILAILAVGFTTYYLVLNSITSNIKTLRMLKSLGASNNYIFEQFKNAYTIFGIKASLISICLSLSAFFILYTVFNVSNVCGYLVICSCFIISIPVIILMLMAAVSKFATSKSISWYLDYKGL